MLLKNFKNVKNILFYDDKLWISTDESRLNVIQKVHDQSTVKHSEIKRTHKFVRRLYYWSEMKNYIERYIRNYHLYKWFKTSRDRYSEWLNSFLISNKLWIDITINFVTELFISNEFNVILMIVNKLIKMRHYIFCTAKKKHFYWKNNTFVNQSRVKSTRSVWYYSVQQRISIRLISLKIALQSIENNYQIVDHISFRDERSKWDN
jgi:hypothetical protein